ncbi:MAG: hypothetical protein WC670_03550 [Pseudolabrys sp.]|jgi:hypothetical protein
MIARRSSRQAAIAAAIVSFAIAVLAVPAPARAADDGEDKPFDSKILGGIMESLGFRKDGEAIVYQERAPLVIPPNTSLPVPEKSDAVIANNPAWPKDPDVQRRKEAAKRARADAYKSADQKLREEQRVLSPSEMMPGANANNRAPRVGNDPNRTSTTFNETGDKLTPSQLGYRGGLFSNVFGGKDDEIARFTGEPARTELTEPPAGYQTPSPDQPYGYNDRREPTKATDYYDSKGGDMQR